MTRPGSGAGQGAEKAPVYQTLLRHRPNLDEVYPGRRNEPIGVFGDYDTDGVTSAALLTLALRAASGEEDGFMEGIFASSPDVARTRRLQESRNVAEAAIETFADTLAHDHAFVLVAEGLEGGRRCYPEGRDDASVDWRIIIDPIDGTRGLMYQKRSAWVLTGVAPNRRPATSAAIRYCQGEPRTCCSSGPTSSSPAAG